MHATQDINKQNTHKDEIHLHIVCISANTHEYVHTFLENETFRPTYLRLHAV